MNDQGFLERLRQDVAAVKAEGRKTIRISALERYMLDAAQGDQMSSDQRHQVLLAQYDARIQTGLELFRATIDAGREALKAALLINGGAAVALLGFLGAAISQHFPTQLGLAVTAPLGLFGVGVFCAAFGFGARYASQAFYGHERVSSGVAFHVLAILAGLSSYSAFLLGIYKVCTALALHFAA